MYKKLKVLIKVLQANPYNPPYEKLICRDNTYSRRLNIQHRLVYEIFEDTKTVKLHSCWTHYE
ncbi:Txe/YoeB family addiction module toxin [Megasphaera cerevisiae]|uniref:Txe/YoeB family addiction module toxin n=1 Tax=Megasphaera cerevisiae TaxID=39029 RepID=UPI003396DB10